MVEVLDVTTEQQCAQVRVLLWAFVDWCRVRYADHLAQVESYFDRDAYAAELAGLPGGYAPPRGRLLLARLDGQPAGCVAFRPFDATSCEMKRMYVMPALHGRGVGRALATRLIHEARASGYARMLLDTGFLQIEAQNLYHSLGFVDIAPYYPVPAEQRGGALFMELQL